MHQRFAGERAYHWVTTTVIQASGESISACFVIYTGGIYPVENGLVAVQRRVATSQSAAARLGKLHRNKHGNPMKEEAQKNTDIETLIGETWSFASDYSSFILRRLDFRRYYGRSGLDSRVPVKYGRYARVYGQDLLKIAIWNWTTWRFGVPKGYFLSPT